ncbi:FAD-binding protein [Nocardia goodfellowii]
MSSIETDVLVLGGGPAGAWAAVSAATAGARVVLVDKGRCATGGPAVPGGETLWHVPPGPARDEAVRHAYRRGGGLGDPELMHRVLDETHRQVDQLRRRGRFPGELGGVRVCLDEPGYLRRLRRRLWETGVRVLDHHPAVQLLVDRDGVVGGATGLRRGHRYQSWTVRAGAVVVATGGCAFLSGAGAEANTGDGLLLAAEAGAHLSGMEFSGGYGLAPVMGSPAGALRFEKLYDDTGSVLSDCSAACTEIGQGRRVYAALDDLPMTTRDWLSQRGAVASGGRVPLRPVPEGTVGGTGGLLLVAPDCATTVAGLYAAGDVTTREPIIGAAGDFGGQGGAWAIASGVWAGAGAARFALGRGELAPARPVPGAGLNPRARIDPRAVVGLVQEHTLPLRRSYWRCAGSLRDSIAELDAMWPGAEFDLGGHGADRLRARQAAALLAVARWTKYSALARTESRGVHRRTDHPGAAEDWRVRLTSGGLDRVWVRAGARRPVVPVAAVRPAALPVPLSRRPDAVFGSTGEVGPELSPAVRRSSGQESVLAVARVASAVAG